MCVIDLVWLFRWRGLFGTIFQVFIVTGILFMYSVGVSRLARMLSLYLALSLSLARALSLLSFSHSISLSLSLVLFSYLNVCLSTLSTYLSIYKACRGFGDTSDVKFSIRENFLSVKEFTWGAKKTKADYVTRYVKHPTPLHKANFPPVCSGFA